MLKLDHASGGYLSYCRDNNYGDDRLFYAQGQLWLQKHHIMGRAVG